MNVGLSLLSQVEDGGLGSLYLPSIGFGFLFIQSSSETLIKTPFVGEISIYFLGFVASILSAVLLHEFMESYSGPFNGSSDPTTKGDIYQRIAFTIFTEGKPEDYPKDYKKPFWEYDVKITKKRVLVFLTLLMATLLLILSYFYTILTLSDYAIKNSSLLPASISFIQIIFILGMIIDGMFPSTYLWYELSEPSIEKKVEEFAFYVRKNTKIRTNDGVYDPSDGGHLEMGYESDAKSGKEEQEIIEYLITGYTGIIIPDDFPCQELLVTIYENEKEVAEYSIETQSVTEFLNGEKEMNTLSKEVVDSITFKDD